MNFHFRKFLMISACWGAAVTAHASSSVAEENILNELRKKNGYTYEQAREHGKLVGIDLDKIERFRQFRQAATKNTPTVTPPAQISSARTFDYNTIQRMTVPSHVMPTSSSARNVAPTPNQSSRPSTPAQFVTNQDNDDDLIEAMRQSIIENQVHQRKLEVERKEVERQGNIRQQEAARLAQEQQTREDNARAVALARQQFERTLQPADFTGDQILKSVEGAAEKIRLDEIPCTEQSENAMRALQIHGERERDLQPAELTEDQALALALEQSEAAERTRQDNMRHAQQLEIEQQDSIAAFKAYQAYWYNTPHAQKLKVVEQENIKAKRLLQLQQDEKLARAEQELEDHACARKLDEEDEYRSVPPRGTADIQSYTIKNMPGTHNNCGFYSMCHHLLGDDFKIYDPRQFVTDNLLDADVNEKIRNLVSSEIRRAVLLEFTIAQTPEISNSIENYWKCYDEQDNKVRQINDQLGAGGLDAESIMLSNRVDASLKGQLAEIIEHKRKAFNDIIVWSRKPETYRAYITNRVAPNGIMLSYHYGVNEFGNGANNTGVIDAIAELFNLRLEIYQYDNLGQYKLKHEYIPTMADTTARLLHHACNGTSVNAVHYDTLEKRAQ